MVGRVGHERHVAGSFDCSGQHPLMLGTVPRFASRDNTPTSRHVLPHQIEVFVVDTTHLVTAETADFRASSEPKSPPPSTRTATRAAI